MPQGMTRVRLAPLGDSPKARGPDEQSANFAHSARRFAPLRRAAGVDEVSLSLERGVLHALIGTTERASRP